MNLREDTQGYTFTLGRANCGAYVELLGILKAWNEG